MSFVVSLGASNLIRFGIPLVAGSEKDSSSLSFCFSRFPSLGGWQEVRVCMYASLVSFGDSGLYFYLCSLWQTGLSV